MLTDVSPQSSADLVEHKFTQRCRHFGEKMRTAALVGLIPHQALQVYVSCLSRITARNSPRCRFVQS